MGSIPWSGAKVLHPRSTAKTNKQKETSPLGDSKGCVSFELCPGGPSSQMQDIFPGKKFRSFTIHKDFSLSPGSQQKPQ